MTPKAIQKHLHHQPFEPFRVCLSDGATYEVRQRGMVLVLQQEVIIALSKPGEQLPRHTVSCNLLHITRIEPINGRSRPKNRD